MNRHPEFGLLDGLAWAGYQTLLGSLFLGCAAASPLLIRLSRRVCEGLPHYLGRLPRPKAGSLVWLHGVSQGESMVAIGLADSLKRRHPHLRIGFTTTHPDVLASAAKKSSLDAVSYAPIDFFPFLRQALNRWHPRLIINTETDFWPGLSVLANRRHIPLVLINGRISEKLHRFYSHLPIFGRLIFGSYSLLAVQSEADRQRLLGMGARPETIQVLGNMKADLVPTSAPEAVRIVSAWQQGSPLVVFGSLHPSEFRALLPDLPRLFQETGCRILIAPRNISFAADWQKLLSGSGIRSILRSLTTGTAARVSSSDLDARVLLLDTMGELGTLYSLARLAFVGGSLDPLVGGHNPIEAIRYGVPTLIGPHTRNFTDLVEDLKLAEAIGICSSASALTEDLIQLLRNPTLAARRSEQAQVVLRRHQGAVSRTLQALQAFLPSS